MGSPFTSVLADIFMGFYESKWLNEYNPNKAKGLLLLKVWLWHPSCFSQGARFLKFFKL